MWHGFGTESGIRFELPSADAEPEVCRALSATVETPQGMKKFRQGQGGTMGPAKYCSLCNGLHPEGLHYTLRGTLAPEPVLGSMVEDGNTVPPPAAEPGAHDGMPMPLSFRAWDRAQ